MDVGLAIARSRRGALGDAATLTAAGLIFHRFSHLSYPRRPAPVASLAPAPPEPPIHPENLDRALADLGETFDVSREDLERLLSGSNGTRRSAAWPLHACSDPVRRPQ